MKPQLASIKILLLLLLLALSMDHIHHGYSHSHYLPSYSFPVLEILDAPAQSESELESEIRTARMKRLDGLEFW